MYVMVDLREVLHSVVIHVILMHATYVILAKDIQKDLLFLKLMLCFIHLLFKHLLFNHLLFNHQLFKHLAPHLDHLNMMLHFHLSLLLSVWVQTQ